MTPKVHKLLLRLETRSKLVWVVSLSIVVSMLDVLSLALIFPIFLLVARSGMGSVSDRLPGPLRSILGENPGSVQLIWLGAAFVGVILVKNLATVWMQHTQFRAASAGLIRLTRRLAFGYLAAPTSFHLGRKNAKYIRGLRDLPALFYYQGALSYCNLIAEIGGVAVITLVLWLLEPLGVLLALIFLGSLIYLNHRIMGDVFQRWGRRSAELVRQTYGYVGQVFPNIKIVKVSGAEDHLFEHMAAIQAETARIERNRRFAQMAIRPISEIVMMMAAVIILAVVLWEKDRAIEALPIVAVFAYGALRLLPAINRMSNYVNELKSASVIVEELESELNDIGAYQEGERNYNQGTTIRFHQSLELRGIGYQYPDGSCPAVSNIDFTIGFGNVLGVTGPSGAGKSTLVDILLGLLEPSEGDVLVDGARPRLEGIDHGAVGYVPQNCPVLNVSLRENIAFGTPPGEINDVEVQRVAAAANLTELVEALPNGFDTEIGEFGADLSGGQRQRIGIARALYGRPSLLILDEATSDLDAKTEFEVTTAINHLRGETTIVLVAHRMHLLKLCDQILFMKDGGIEASGTYEELLASKKEFRELATMTDKYDQATAL